MSGSNVPLAGVIGTPIAHSRSPQLHGHWLRSLSLRGHYIPMEVSPEKLEEALRLLPQLGFVGLNVTIPHKEAVLALADHATPRAKAIGAANTLVFGADGTIHADNTDGYGFLENIRQAEPDWDPAAGPAVVMGAGGASRAVVFTLLEAGVPEVILSNRTRARAEQFQRDFGPRVRVVDWESVHQSLPKAATVVNTTSLGMQGKAPLTVPLDGLQPGTLVNDLVYAPLETDLLAAARARGCRVVDGLGMLLHQAAPGFESWFGTHPQVTDALRAEVLK